MDVLPLPVSKTTPLLPHPKVFLFYTVIMKWVSNTFHCDDPEYFKIPSTLHPCMGYSKKKNHMEKGLAFKLSCLCDHMLALLKALRHFEKEKNYFRSVLPLPLL